jgi:hypothetical protein
MENEQTVQQNQSIDFVKWQQDYDQWVAAMPKLDEMTHVLFTPVATRQQDGWHLNSSFSFHGLTRDELLHVSHEIQKALIEKILHTVSQ